MRLISCYIENFGCHHQLAVEFSRELHVIRADNGWGKSTLAAFLKAMFFGMAYSPRRKLLDNERKRYKPWQGGPWGGYVIFARGEKTYKLERFFGEKDREDTFVLYDWDTGLVSRDFSENIGEELFGVDRDSFVRSSFFPQGNLAAAMTDRLNAKLNRLEEYGGDADQYEHAMALLESRWKVYKRSGGRGCLAEWERELAALRRKREQCVEKERERETYKAQLDELLEQERTVGDELTALREQEERMHKSQIAQAGMRHKEMLLRQLREVEEQLKPLDDYFRGGVPGDEELEELLLEDMQRGELLAGRDDSALWEAKNQWEREKARLEQMKEAFGGALSEMPMEAEDGRGRLAAPQGWLPLCGAAAVCFGIFLMVALPGLSGRPTGTDRLSSPVGLIGLFSLAAGVFLLGIWAVRGIRADRKKDREKRYALWNAQRDRVRLQSQHFRQLEEEQRIRTEECRRQLSQIEDKKRDFLRKYQMGLPSLGREELLEMRDRQRDYLRLAEQLTRHQKEWENYSQENGKQVDVLDLGEEKELSTWQLQKRRYELERQWGELLQSAESCRKDMALLEKEAGDLDETECEIHRLTEQYEEGKNQADLLEKTMAYLKQAKERYAVRYMERMQQGFRKFTEILDGAVADRLKLDVDLQPGEEAVGSLHSQDYMSTGLREFAGICTRLALVEAMYEGEKPFLVMDDPFTNLDEKKVERGWQFLERLSSEYQIIYFTCHGSRCKAGNAIRQEG